MNCHDCQNLLQQWLDARTRDGAGDPPVLCPACAGWAAAARRLDRGLRLTAPPIPPAYLADRIVGGVRAERGFRRYRAIFAVGMAATAAALLFALWQGLHGGGPPPIPAPAVSPPVVQAPEPMPATEGATLGDSVAEASSAVASLTTRTADATVEKTNILPPVVPEPALAKLDLESPLDPTTRSLRETGQGVSAGLEPVADSARRAVGLFLRQLPVDATPRTGF